MLLIIASRHDQLAQLLVERWKDHDARILSCRDLSTPGWRYYVDEPHASCIVVGNRVVDAADIKGALVRLPEVTARELPQIRAADRSYVAAEMTSFLAAWLSRATFPVVNRPTPTCLMGPAWGEQQWAYQASRVGLRTRKNNRPSQSRRLEENPKPAPIVVTVIGDNCMGPVTARTAAQVRRLAEAARVEMLTVALSGADENAEFVGAFLGVDTSRPEVADALLRHFQNSSCSLATTKS